RFPGRGRDSYFCEASGFAVPGHQPQRKLAELSFSSRSQRQVQAIQTGHRFECTFEIGLLSSRQQDRVPCDADEVEVGKRGQGSLLHAGGPLNRGQQAESAQRDSSAAQRDEDSWANQRRNGHERKRLIESQGNQASRYAAVW